MTRARRQAALGITEVLAEESLLLPQRHVVALVPPTARACCRRRGARLAAAPTSSATTAAPAFASARRSANPTNTMEIPFTLLQPDTLRALIEEFVLREGTEYGERDVSLDDKVDAVMQQLKRGEARVLYDADSETTHIAAANGGHSASFRRTDEPPR